jgi:NADH dehydrogenase FAD-containing subunit
MSMFVSKTDQEIGRNNSLSKSGEYANFISQLVNWSCAMILMTGRLKFLCWSRAQLKVLSDSRNGILIQASWTKQKFTEHEIANETNLVIWAE